MGVVDRARALHAYTIKETLHHGAALPIEEER